VDLATDMRLSQITCKCVSYLLRPYNAIGQEPTLPGGKRGQKSRFKKALE